MLSLRNLSVPILGLALAGCGGPPIPEQQLTAAQSALGQAESQLAADAAPVEYTTAKQKLEQARAAVDAGRNEDARRLAEQAELDANLAMARAGAADAREMVAELRAGIEALQAEIRETPLQ